MQIRQIKRSEDNPFQAHCRRLSEECRFEVHRVLPKGWHEVPVPLQACFQGNSRLHDAGHGSDALPWTYWYTISSQRILKESKSQAKRLSVLSIPSIIVALTVVMWIFESKESKERTLLRSLVPVLCTLLNLNSTERKLARRLSCHFCWVWFWTSSGCESVGTYLQVFYMVFTVLVCIGL